MAWNQPVHRGTRSETARPLPLHDGRVSFERAVERYIEGHLSAKTGRPYSTTSKRNIRDNLLGGRLSGWREKQGIATADQWTAETAAAYLAWYQHEMGADSDTIKKVRTQLRQFAAYCAETLGHETALGPALSNLRISSAPDERKSKEGALNQAEAAKLLAATGLDRDKLIVGMLLYTGMRPSELVGLEEQHIRLDRSPPVVMIRGTVHDPEQTKSHAGLREIPLTIGQTLLPRLLKAHLTDPKRPMGSYRLFLSTRRDPLRNATPITQDGVERVLAKLGTKTGIHCNPYRFRHTFCTWCADAGMHMLHLQQLLGHASSDMVAYYYRGRTSDAVLAAAARVRF